MCSDLLYPGRDGNNIIDSVYVTVTEPEPVLVGKLQVGVAFVMKQVAVPKEYGETDIASARRAQSERSERGRVERGYPRNPGGPVGLSVAVAAPIVKMAAANDPPPWNDDDDSHLPPTAVAADIGFMDEVAVQRSQRQQTLRAEHYDNIDSKIAAECQREHLKEMHGLRRARLRQQYDLSMITTIGPNKPGLRSNTEYRWDPGPDSTVRTLTADVVTVEAKQPTVEVATRNAKAPRLLDNIQWGSLSDDAKRKFVDFMFAAACPDLGNVRVHSLGRYNYKFHEATISGWYQRFTLDQRSTGRELLDTKRYKAWLEREGARGDSSNDAAQYDRLSANQVTDDVSMQAWLSAKERENPSQLYEDSCESCQAKARAMAPTNVYLLRERRPMTEKERNILIGEIEERGEEAKGQAESAESTGVKLEGILSQGNATEGMTEQEKDVFFKTLTRSDVSPDDLAGAIRHSWSILKQTDLGMAKSMFNHWLPGKGGLVLPPNIS
jgi:hypothetical protein